MLLASVCNPIFINTFVVFIRLYWFERRFQNVVLEARSMRRSRTRSIGKSESKPNFERDISREENGVGDREIMVLRGANGHAKGKKIDDEEAFQEGDLVIEDTDDESGNGSSSREESGTVLEEDISPTTTKPDVPFHRNITFADEVASPADDRLPQKNKEQSIAFVQNQRNPKDQATFRIPGPRDYDRGLVPERIEEGTDLKSVVTNNSNEGETLQKKRSRSVSRSRPTQELNSDDHPLKSHITIDVPDVRRRPTTGASVYNRTRRRSDVSENEPPSGFSGPNRSRSRTLGSFLSREREEEDPMPYLSWTPTVGRNSAFVDLTEEQREELGGIEYRALKLLAVVLVSYFVGFHLLGMICLLPWVVNDAKYSGKLQEVGVSPVWW